MKNCLLILLLFLRPVSSFCQRDSIKKEILNHNDEKAVTILKGRSLLIEKFLIGDLMKVKEIKDYLISDIEDRNYAVFYPEEYWLILYWTQEYRELIESISHDNYLQINSFASKIKPQDNQLFNTILNQSDSEESRMHLFRSINNSNLPDIDKEFLAINLDFLLSINKDESTKQELFNESADKFLTKYPDSKFDNYIRIYIRNKLVPVKWGFGAETFIGNGWFTYDPENLFKDNFSFGIDLDFKYTRLQMSLRALYGFSKTNQDIPYSKGTWAKDSQAEIGQIETSLGYILTENEDIKITSFIGMAGTSILPGAYDIKQNADLKQAGFNFLPSCSFGLNYDIKLGEFKKRFFNWSGPEKNYLFLRIKYSCNLILLNKNYSDFHEVMHFITIGMGGFGQKLEREY